MPNDTSTKRCTWIWLTPAFAVAAGLLVGWLTLPWIERELAVRRLFSDDSAARFVAASWLLEMTRPGRGGDPVPRLAQDEPLARRLVDRLRPDVRDVSADIFSDVVNVLNSTGFWNPEFVGPDVWLAHIKVLLNDPSSVAANLALDELDELPRASPEVTDALPIWLELLAREGSVDMREEALLRAVRWYGADDDVPGELLMQAADDASPRLRRTAWIVIGILDPMTGFGADWRNEENDRVAEAILWAAIRTNPDRPAPVLEAIAYTPGRMTALPWILSRSTSEEARAELLGLQENGNPAATIPLAEQGWIEPHDPLPIPVNAWLGRGSADHLPDDPALRRWWYWRTSESVTAEEFRQLFGSAQTEDGSVWSSILLAERLLAPEDVRALAQSWIESWNPPSRRAGLLLAGLTGTHSDLIERFQTAGGDASVHQAARLARLMQRGSTGSSPDGHIRTEYAFAQRLLESMDSPRKFDILLAWLASGDPKARESLLEWALKNDSLQDPAASTALFARAWLIERFLPLAYELVARLHPWNDDVAALQMDIVRIADRIRPIRRHQ